ncbi:MAG TPA: dTDP-4-dehydrorhamnose 3,5-epimerase, partial [Sphingomonadaceae bacterium]|nr:dTDP-4-dehydrorhamnose 3,5-epimerase [Sphingomonadaceae bacterium]
MKLCPTELPEVLIIEPSVFGDERGFFLESWNESRFAEAGLDLHFVQDNHSRSGRGVLRGIHYQLAHPQGKLVRVTAGKVFDVAVDLRRSSPTFGRWAGVELSVENKRMLWLPPGFGHGFLTLEGDTDFLYKCTDFYAPEDEHCIAWNDPEIGITWPVTEIDPILSQKDRAGL